MKGLVLYGRTGKFTYRMLMTVLVGQMIAVFFGALVARGIASAQGTGAAGTHLWLGVALSLLCVVGAGLMRRSPLGVSVGWAVQLLTFAYAVVLPPMIAVGVIFLALWVGCLVQGRKVDVEDARRAAEREAT